MSFENNEVAIITAKAEATQNRNDNNLDLVFFDQGNLMKAEAVTTSRKIAEIFRKEHKHVLDSIRTHYKRLAKISADLKMYKVSEKTYLDSQNKKQKYLEINFNMFILIVMSYTGETALKFKNAYITKFEQMRMELAGTRQMRQSGIGQRKELTKVIKEKLHKLGDDFIYARITNLCYKFVFDKTFKQLKDFYGVKTTEGLRDFVGEAKLDEVAKLELKVSMWIEDFDLTENQVRVKLVKFKKKLYA